MANNCTKKERICIHCGKSYLPNSNRQKYCKNCKNIQQLSYWRNNKDKRKIIDQKRYIKNKDIILKQHKIWADKNKEHLRKYNSEYRKNRKEKDISFKIRLLCRTVINRCIILGSTKDKHTFDILGYTPEMLKQRLEMNFKSDMNWGNHGTLWHIDHVKPLCKFNFVLPDGTPDYEQIRLANSLANLQPLYVEENLSKGGK